MCLPFCLERTIVLNHYDDDFYFYFNTVYHSWEHTLWWLLVMVILLVMMMMMMVMMVNFQVRTHTHILEKHPAGCGIARVGASTCWKKWQPFQCFVAFWSGKKCSQKRSFFLDFATLTAQISDLFCLATFIDHCACRPHWLVIWWIIILTIWKIAIIPSISNNDDQHMKLEGDFYHHWDELYRYRGERHYQQKYDNHYKLLWCTPQNR